MPVVPGGLHPPPVPAQPHSGTTAGQCPSAWSRAHLGSAEQGTLTPRASRTFSEDMLLSPDLGRANGLVKVTWASAWQQWGLEFDCDGTGQRD